ncbi:MAG: DUF2007 domain-containing protein [Planctomycetaceae bacterium]|nr:DUF2007 domain-containing protein [Planctomycetaceae bacterium]
MENEKRLVTIAQFDNSFDAELAKITLENEGLKAVVVGDNLAHIQPYSFPNAVKLQVLQPDAERAATILQEKNPLPDESEPDEPQEEQP